MTAATLPVLSWPAREALARMRPNVTVFCISVDTPPSTDRTIGRHRIRVALREALGILLGASADQIALQSIPGKPVTLAGYAIGVSLAHESGLSVAAINLTGAVGVDLLHVPAVDSFLSDWENLSRDYLGPAATRRIGLVIKARQPHIFAEEWTAREAMLKSRGLGLVEWPGVSQPDLRSTHRYQISPAENTIGTVITTGSSASETESRPS